MCGVGIVGGVLGVFGEGDGVGELDGRGVDVDVDAEVGEGLLEFGVEVGDRLRAQWLVGAEAGAGAEEELVVDEVEFDFEEVAAVGHGGGAEAARADVEWDVPPVGLQRAEREADLADYLCPHVEGFGGGRPFFPAKFGPEFEFRAPWFPSRPPDECLGCGIVVEVGSKPAFDFVDAHLLAGCVVGDLVAADLAEREVARFGMREV